MHSLLTLLRPTLRRLARAPLFTAVALLTLAIGIGANTAIFTVVDGVLLKPLPYAQPEQLVALWHTAPGVNITELNMMFVRDGLVLSAIVAACGLAAAWALTRLMQSLLYEVSPGDPLTYGAVSLRLIVAAALASYLPARKASKVDPMIALRAE